MKKFFLVVIVAVGIGLFATFLVPKIISQEKQRLARERAAYVDWISKYKEPNVLWNSRIDDAGLYVVEMGDGHDYILVIGQTGDTRFNQFSSLVHAAGCRACNPKVAKTGDVEAHAK